MLTFSVNTNQSKYRETVQEAIEYTEVTGYNDLTAVIDRLQTTKGFVPHAVEHKASFTKYKHTPYSRREVPFSSIYLDFEDNVTDQVSSRLSSSKVSNYLDDLTYEDKFVIDQLFSNYKTSDFESLVGIDSGYSITGILNSIVNGKTERNEGLPNPKDLLFYTLEKINPDFSDFKDDIPFVLGVMKRILENTRRRSAY